jgi:hypothetical protein
MGILALLSPDLQLADVSGQRVFLVNSNASCAPREFNHTASQRLDDSSHEFEFAEAGLS